MSLQRVFQEVILPRLLAAFACFQSRSDRPFLTICTKYLEALLPSLLLGDVWV